MSPHTGGTTIVHPVYDPNDFIHFVPLSEPDPQSHIDFTTGDCKFLECRHFQGAIDLDHPDLNQE